MAWIEKIKLKKGLSYYVRYKNNKVNKIFGKYPTKQLAEKARLECEIQLTTQQKKEVKILKLSELWDIYQKRKLDVRASTLTRYNQQLQNWYNICNDTSIDNITIDIIFKYIEIRKKTVKTKTINEEISFLRTLLKYAVKWEYIDRNVFDRVDNLKVTDSKQTPVLTPEIIQAVNGVLNNEFDKWFSDVFVTALYTGMRLGEILNLEWDNIDFQNNIINIEISKTDPRSIPIHPKIKKMLIELQHKHKEYEFTDNYIFRTMRNEPLQQHQNAIRHKFIRVMKQAGFHNITQFHSTRHTFVTHFLKFSNNKELTGFISGHKSNAIDIYIHDVHSEQKQRVMSEFEY